MNELPCHKPFHMNSELRTAGRSPLQLRPLSCQHGLLNKSDGSVEYRQDKTAVLASVQGPVESSRKEERIDVVVVEVHITSATNAKYSFAETAVRNCLEAVLVMGLHPRCTIHVDLHVMHADGSLLSALINAACLAMLDAGISMTSMVSAITLVIDKDERILLDPESREEAAAHAIATFAFDSVDNHILLAYSVGCVSVCTLEVAKKSALLACKTMHDFFRASLREKIKKEAVQS